MKLIHSQTAIKHTKTCGMRSEIDEIFSPILLNQKAYGFQVLDPNWSWRKNSLNHICILLLITYVIFGTIDFINHTNDITLLTEAIVTMIITFTFPLKLICFIYYRYYFREVYIMAKCTLFGIVKEISPERVEKIAELLQKIVKALFTLVVAPTFNYLVLALWAYYNGTRVTLSRTTSILMPMTSPYYEIGLILHLNFLYMAAFVIMIWDFWFVFLTHLFCETCDCAVKILQVAKIHGEEDIPYAIRLNDALGKFYFIHVKIMQYLKTLNDMYKWAVLIPLIAVLMITCLFLLVMTEETNWQLVTVVVPASCEVFAYNLLGERIKTKANNINMALLNFDWTSMKLKNRKNYLIMISCANREFSICTAFGVELSLLTLSNIYKASYQMFAVFNTTKN